MKSITTEGAPCQDSASLQHTWDDVSRFSASNDAVNTQTLFLGHDVADGVSKRVLFGDGRVCKVSALLDPGLGCAKESLRVGV